ncbi:MAG TPA: hypothetical protein PKA82_17770 [Pyrinomonadaceae bacterium]|nr:hypothetical protein [Pyrinomonadaceae bacterium]
MPFARRGLPSKSVSSNSALDRTDATTEATVAVGLTLIRIPCSDENETSRGYFIPYRFLCQRTLSKLSSISRTSSP